MNRQYLQQYPAIAQGRIKTARRNLEAAMRDLTMLEVLLSPGMALTQPNWERLVELALVESRARLVGAVAPLGLHLTGATGEGGP